MRFFVFLFGLVALTVPHAAFAEEYTVFGLYERVLLPEVAEKAIPAKLDTGATVSSLGATDIELFEKDGEDWVRFTPQLKNTKKVELPLKRHTIIKRRLDRNGNSGPKMKRPVVIMDVCIDNKRYPVEVNLADRSNFEFPLLIGSDALISFGALVDPSKQYLQQTTCP